MATARQKPGVYPAKLRIKKGDQVMVIAGADKGKTGKILRAFPKFNKVLVEGVNIITKHQKARQTGRPGRSGAQQIQEGGRIQKPAPMYVPKVMLVCPHCGRATRVGYTHREGDEKLAARKYRVCKHPDCAKSID
jgi:large subunit ribosomal protein L24